jgi:hypothetical protein
MILPKRYVEICERKGVRLDQIAPGSSAVALPRSAALEALRTLDKSSIAVLGGDVLQLSQGKLKYVYANWYCNREGNETPINYVERSKREALSYVEKFKPFGDFEPLFVLVLSDSIEKADFGFPEPVIIDLNIDVIKKR